MVPLLVPGRRRMFTSVGEHGMVPLLVPGVFPPVGFSMQAHVFFRDTWHHPYISSCFCGKHFYSPFIMVIKVVTLIPTCSMCMHVYHTPTSICMCMLIMFLHNPGQRIYRTQNTELIARQRSITLCKQRSTAL